MFEKVLRIKDICKIIGVSHTTIYNWVKCGSFPKPFRLSDSSNRVGWRESTIRTWLVEREQSEHQISPK